MSKMSERKRRWAFVIEQDRCIGCEACMVACSVENNVPRGKYRNWVINTPISGKFPDLEQEYIPGNCLHCDDPPCVTACPTGASYTREDGLVLIDADICIGCRYCIAACPYGARYRNDELGVVDKCSACVHRLDAGRPPACVETCIGGSRHFGDLNDPESKVSKLLATGRAKPFHPETGTGPQFYYITSAPESHDTIPVKEEANAMTHLWQKMEQPAALGLLGSAVVVTGAAYTVARRNAKKHFEEVEREMRGETKEVEEREEDKEDATE